MNIQIILCLYHSPRPSMPSLQGRSGKIYCRAVYNEKMQRHETPPFDLDEWHNTILPDISKLTGRELPQWLPAVVATEPAAGEDTARLEGELAAAHAEIKRLTGTELKGATERPPARTLVDTFGSLPEPSPVELGSLAPKGVRELRAMCKERGITIPTSATKDDLLRMLETPELAPA